MTPRRLLLLALVPLALTGCAKKGGSTAAGSQVREIKMTGIDAFDNVFREARDIDNRLDGAREKITSGRNNLNSALGLTKGTPFKDAVSDLRAKTKGKLELVMQGATPQLKVKDAIPTNVQSAVDSLNGSMQNYKNAADDILGIKGEVKSVVNAVKDFPSRLSQDYKSMNISLVDLPDQINTVKNNVRLIGNFPHRVDKLTGELTGDIAMVGNLFRGGGGGGSSNSGGNNNSSGDDKKNSAVLK